MAPKSQGDDLLSRPLYIFDLPEELLYTLTLKDASAVTPAPQDDRSADTPSASPAPPSQDIDSPPSSKPAATSCGLCNLKFPTLQDQRSHVRSDLHNYNLKQQIKGLKPVSEFEFEKLIGDLDESISGSDSESESEDDTSKDTTLTALLKRQAKLSNDEPGDTSRKSIASGSPLIWLQSDKLPSNTSLGIYKATFSKEEQEEPGHLVDAIRKKQMPSTVALRKGQKPTSNGSAKNAHYFLCMIGGGHFAAMIVSLAAKVDGKHPGKNERQADVLAHKTFHRYTTRRKQGGAQSASDASRGAAHSAGSSLRRYNEAALTAEVRQLLTDWKSMIDTADLLFIRATGNTNRQTLFAEYEGRVLRQNDPRIRGFPFNTRRATQSELMRAFVELTRVKVSQIDEAALAAAQEKEKAKTEQPKAAPSKPKAPKLSEEEETATLHTNQIQSLVRRSKAPALLNYFRSNDLSADFTFFPEATNHHAPTALHLAASLSSPALITALLVKGKVNPTKTNADGKTAYDIAGDRATRDAFRSARHTLGEGAFDWNAANVPAALSPEELTERGEQEKKEKAAEDAKEAARRKQNLQKLEEDAAAADESKREKKFGKGKTLAGVEKTGADRREEEGRGMTPEMRARLERERRARAAEERMKRLQGGS